jgi:5-formyltetrahydrofolate cyclo-ligase
MAPPPFFYPVRFETHPLVHASPASAKTALRLQMRAVRKDLAASGPGAAELAANHLPEAMLGRYAIVSGYRAQGSEFDPWPLLQRLAAAGARLALPVAVDRDSALTFRAYSSHDRMVPDAFGIPAPPPGAEVVEPDLVIVPILAFDRAGHRMGQGAGHYDRTIATLRARRPPFVLGLAYAGQEVARIPAEPHDQALDAILTENGYIEAQRNP